MKKIILLIISYFLLWGGDSFAQDRHVVDSLQNELKKFEANKKELGGNALAITDTTKAKILLQLFNQYVYGNTDTAMYYAQQSLNLSEQIGFKRGIGSALNSIGWSDYQKGNYKSALECTQKALKIFKEIGYKKGISSCYNSMGGINYVQGNYPEALKNHFNSLSVRQELGDKQSSIISYINIGAVYQKQGNYTEALKAEFAALKISEEIGSKGSISASYGNIANTYEYLNNYPEALKNQLIALKIDKEIDDKNGITTSEINLGLIYSAQGRYNEALANYNEAMKIYEQSGNKYNLAGVLEDIAAVNNLMGNYKEALKNNFSSLKLREEIGDKQDFASSNINIGIVYEKQGSLKEALSYESKGLTFALETGAKDQVKDAYSNLAEINAKLKNYEAAYKNEVLFKQYYDSIYNKENEKKLTGLQMQYDFDKKQQADSIQHASENKVNLLNLHKQKIFTSMGITGLMLVMLLLFFVYRNFTNQRKATAAMSMARQRAEQSEKYKEQFLANMSHEIRTPMNAVMGMTNLLLDKNPRSDQFKYLDGMQKSSETLLHIINDILDISKIEAGKIDLEQLDFSISEVLQQVKYTLQHKAEEKGLHLVTDIDSHVPDVIIGDPVRLNQVLMNLAGNAIKFTDKGSVTIEVMKGTKDNAIRFSIIDTGIGIPKDKLQKVFESFSQAHASDTRKFGGTGLGLSISKQLVELMGGTISIESEEGAGSTFSFEIICTVGSKEKVDDRKTAEQIDGSILNGLKILIVDDNAYNRTVAHDTLTSKANVEITEAVNGKEAIEWFGRKPFDVILMDVQMPVMDGYEATRLIRAMDDPKNKIPIIALTASVIRSDLDKCRAAGMNDYVPKPFKASQLIAAIAKATNREIKFDKTNGVEKANLQKKDSIITDLSYLEIFCEGDEVRMNKYISMFLETAPTLIEKINQALSQNDFEEIANQVHGYKTKWIMMGMSESKDLALKIEKQCRETSPQQSVKENISTLIGQIKTAMIELS